MCLFSSYSLIFTENITNNTFSLAPKFWLRHKGPTVWKHTHTHTYTHTHTHAQTSAAPNLRVINSVKKPNSTKKRSSCTRTRITCNPVLMLKRMYLLKNEHNEVRGCNKSQIPWRLVWECIQSRAGATGPHVSLTSGQNTPWTLSVKLLVAYSQMFCTFERG